MGERRKMGKIEQEPLVIFGNGNPVKFTYGGIVPEGFRPHGELKDFQFSQITPAEPKPEIPEQKFNQANKP